jgi:hypothetical protein
MSLSTLRKEALLNGEFAKLIKDFANDKKWLNLKDPLKSRV